MKFSWKPKYKNRKYNIKPCSYLTGKNKFFCELRTLMLFCVVFLCAPDYPGDSRESVALEWHHMSGCLPAALRSDIQPPLLRHRLPLRSESGPNVRSIPSRTEEMTDVQEGVGGGAWGAELMKSESQPPSSGVRMEEEVDEDFCALLKRGVKRRKSDKYLSRSFILGGGFFLCNLVNLCIFTPVLKTWM